MKKVNIWKYLGKYKKDAALTLFKVFEVLCELTVPLLMANIIDVGIANGDTGYILKMGAVLLLVAVFSLSATIVAQYFAAKASMGFASEVRRALFSHIGTLSYTEIDKSGTDTLITRLTSDVNQLGSGMNLTLRLVLRSPLVVFGAVIMAFTIDTRAALIFVVTVPALALVVFAIMLITMPLYRKVQSSLDKILGLTRENITGARVIRAFCMEDGERESFSLKNGELKSRQLFVGKISALMDPLTFIIVNAATIILLRSGAVRVYDGAITQGELVALVNYMSQILTELLKLANLIITISKSLASASRITDALSTESEEETGVLDAREADKSSPILEFRDVGIKYAGAGSEALCGVNLTVNRGDTVGVIGGTGSGKSTLVNLIPRYYDATEGELLFCGRDIRDYDRKSLRSMTGVVSQSAPLFSGTIRENIAFGRGVGTGENEVSDEKIMNALGTAQALDFVSARDGGLDSEITEGGRNLSGGQRQRLTIARALVRDPEILILDDSASALDFATDARLRGAIARLSPEMTVFIVSQRAASVRYADKIVVLDDGKPVGVGTHDELIESCPVYENIYYSQFERKDKKDETEGAK
ncbi:MAG: ABC transporter ATP-binding protein/permease [Clostridiales bacterium]|nr:ABC transporter ATP-binding protein/permease [Clostridiales bacterium]